MKTNKLDEVSDGISVQEAARRLGKRGGTVTRDRYGDEFYRRIGAKGGKRQKELYRDLLAEFGRRGGRPRRPSLEDSGKGLPEKKGDERSAPGSPSPA